MMPRSHWPNPVVVARSAAHVVLIALVAVLSGCVGDSDNGLSPLPAHPFRVPSASAWAYLADDQRYNEIPYFWREIDFRVVDLLILGPAGIQADGRFGLYNSPTTGDLGNRFRWIIERARAQNPAITILVSQWWGTGPAIWGRALDQLKTEADYAAYARSVRDFLEAWQDIGGGFDGYDIDYEDNNVVPNLKPLADRLRTELDSLAKASGRPYYFSVSPVFPWGLEKSYAAIDLVNVQTYAGGFEVTKLDYFFDAGFPPGKLLYGVCPEAGCDTPTVAEAITNYRELGLAGIHLWRLNSGNWKQELEWQRQVYDALH